MNSNILAGMACPQCKSEGPFYISCSLSAKVTDDECDTTGSDAEWDNDSACVCDNCSCSGIVRDFEKLGPKYNHMYTIAFTIVDGCIDGSQPLAKDVRDGIMRRIRLLPDDELVNEAIEYMETYEET